MQRVWVRTDPVPDRNRSYPVLSEVSQITACALQGLNAVLLLQHADSEVLDIVVDAGASLESFVGEVPVLAGQWTCSKKLLTKKNFKKQ